MRRGLSLLETLVAGGLLLLLMTMALNFLSPSFRNSSRGALRVEMQQRASLSIECLGADLERCAASTVTIFPNEGMALQRLDGFTPGGLQVWEKALVLYYCPPTAGRLVRHLCRPAALPNRDEFLALLARPVVARRVLADSVRQFELSSTGRLVRLRLVLERGLKERFEIQRSFYLRTDW